MLTDKIRANTQGKKAVARKETERQILDAFLELLEEKGYGSISVSDIISRSGVARSTFYRHYTSVYDVLIQLGYYLGARLKSASGSATPDFFDRKYLIDLFSSFQSLSHEFTILDNAGVPTHLFELVVHYYEVELGTMSTLSPQRYSLYYYAGAFCCVVSHWMETGMKESPEKMADIFLKITQGHPEDVY